jgi:hypothetical protein
MVLGGLYLPAADVRAISDEIRALKERHGLSRGFEVKWTKVSPAKLEFYEALLQLFFEQNVISFRCVIASKEGLDHERYGQTHDDWYYKIYFQLLREVVKRPNHYRVFLDYKDSYGYQKVEKLRTIVHKVLKDSARETIPVMQPIRSHESELLQLADLLIGAVSHRNNAPEGGSVAKSHLIKLIQGRVDSSLAETTPFRQRKFNVFHWEPSWSGR